MIFNEVKLVDMSGRLEALQLVPTDTSYFSRAAIRFTTRFATAGCFLHILAARLVFRPRIASGFSRVGLGSLASLRAVASFPCKEYKKGNEPRGADSGISRRSTPPPPRRIRKTLDCSLRVRPFFLFFNMRRSRNVKVSWGAPARTHPRPTKYELKANPEPMRCRTPRANLIFPDTFSPLKNPE